MVTVRRTTALPISAEAAFALAQRPATFAYVVRGVLRVPALAAVPDGFTRPGAEASGRMWWLGVVPSWTHHLRLVAIARGEILTAEHGGPIRTWNHRLSFVATSATGCDYTDEITIDAGLLTPPCASSRPRSSPCARPAGAASPPCWPSRGRPPRTPAPRPGTPGRRAGTSRGPTAT